MKEFSDSVCGDAVECRVLNVSLITYVEEECRVCHGSLIEYFSEQYRATRNGNILVSCFLSFTSTRDKVILMA